MPLEDRDIFLAICEHFADQPIEFLMEQYEKAKKLNMGIEKRISALQNEEAQPVIEEVAVAVEEIPEEVPQKKKYTKRNLKVKPQDAITEDYIACCICGLQRQSLTSKHIATHGITVEEYKKLCGYPEDQKLMSNKKLEKSRAVIKLAQQHRLDKRKNQQD